MAGTLNKFRKRNIQTNLYQLILVIFVVAVSVCLISGLIISHLTLEKSVNKFYSESNLPNLWIETDKINSSDEMFLSKFNYTKRACFGSEFQVGEKNYSSKFLVSNRRISTPYIVEGDEGFGCYVDAKFIEKYNIGIGFSKIYFDYSISGETKKIDFTVMGSLAMAEDLLVDDESVIFIDEKVFLQTLMKYFEGVGESDFSVINYNQILIGSEISQSEQHEIESYFETSETNLISIKTRNEIESVVALQKEIDVSKQMLLMFPILFVIISVLVIISSITQLVLKERYNIGLLKSLGFADKKIMSNYSGYGAYIGFFGSIFGLLFSPLIIPNATFDVYDKLFNLPSDEVELSMPILLVILTILVAVVIGYYSAYFVCLKLTSNSPKECMSGRQKINLKSRKKPRKMRKIFAGALSNIKINKTRSTMSLVSVCGCLILMEVGFAVNFLFNSGEQLSIKAFSGIFKWFSGVLLVLTLVILTSQIFKERCREFALLRIHGESHIKIWLSVVMEVFFISFLAFVMSCVMCYPVFVLMLKLFGLNIKLGFEFLMFLKPLAMVVIADVLILLVVLVKINKINLSETIKFSE